ncbi:TPA: hypothetical protein ACO4F7_004686, partial [Escherichia coli]
FNPIIILSFLYKSGILLSVCFSIPASAGFVFSWHSGLQFARQPEQLAPAAPAETTDGARYQITQF